ncbi:MAG: hypothetical protein LBR16_01065 [Treponema sp.]|jgi:hypothetical protein|nr:hypothetical protein [Treponema sp.]
MKRFLTALCTMLVVAVSALSAQTFYEGQGGKNMGAIRVAMPEGVGLTTEEAEILPLVRIKLGSDFAKYAGMRVVDEGDDLEAGYTLTGSVSKRAGAYWITFEIKDTLKSTGTKATYPPVQCTLAELQNLKVIAAASEELIGGMGIRLTQVGKDALKKTTTNEVDAVNAAANASKSTGFAQTIYTYIADQLDPTLAEAASKKAKIQAELFKAPEVTLTLPPITVPQIAVSEFKTPEIKVVATGNIRAAAQQKDAEYKAQKEASRVRQESSNKSLKEMQDAFLVQFKAQSDAVQKQQTELLKQRDILLGQQKTQLARQREIIAQLKEAENSSATFFTEHPPFEIIYDPRAEQAGTQNLEKGIVDLRFRITTAGTTAMQVIPVILADLEKGLKTVTQSLANINTGFDTIEAQLKQAETAGSNALAQLVRNYAGQVAKVETSETHYAEQLAGLDAALKTTGYAQLGRDYAVKPDKGYAEGLARTYAIKSAGYSAAKDKNLGGTWSRTTGTKDETKTFVIEARLENDAGKTIGTARVTLTNTIVAEAYTQPPNASEWCVFRDVPIASITDTMRVTIQKVNGKAVTTSTTYIKVSALTPESDYRYTEDGLDIEGFAKNGRDRFGYDKNGFARNGYNREGYDKAGYARSGYNREGHTRGGYDRTGYNRAGYNFWGYDKNGNHRLGRGMHGVTAGGGGYLGGNAGFGGASWFGRYRWFYVELNFYGGSFPALVYQDYLLGDFEFQDSVQFNFSGGAGFSVLLPGRFMLSGVIGGGAWFYKVDVEPHEVTDKEGNVKTVKDKTVSLPYFCMKAQIDWFFLEGVWGVGLRAAYIGEFMSPDLDKVIPGIKTRFIPSNSGMYFERLYVGMVFSPIFR